MSVRNAISSMAKVFDVGPDLGTVRHQTKQVLLTAILDPSQSISQGFEAYVMELNSAQR